MRRRAFILDGDCIVIETRIGGRYRAYHYCDTPVHHWPEARSVEAILRDIYRFFPVRPVRYSRRNVRG